MIRRRQFLSTVLLLPLLLGSVAATGEALPPRILRVLFIGNSYTHVNDLPGMIAQLLPARGVKLEHESVTPGGATLEKQWADGKALAAIRKQQWDYVVLQEQSMRPFLGFGGVSFAFLRFITRPFECLGKFAPAIPTPAIVLHGSKVVSPIRCSGGAVSARCQVGIAPRRKPISWHLKILVLGCPP
jgi:hypothetical protein